MLKVVLFFAISATVAAQQPPISQNVDRAQLLRTQQPTLRDEAPASGEGPQEAEASPNDPDLGEQAILKRAEQYQPFTVSVAVPFSYTSNVALVPHGAEDDLLFTPGVSVMYAPRITHTLFANISVSQQYFYYDRFSELDFGSFDLRVGLVYSLPQFHNLVLRADYAFNRLMSEQSFDEFYTSHALNLSAEVPFRFGRAQLLSIGAEMSFNLASDPDEPGRHDFGVYAAYSVALTRAFSLSGVARLAVRDYVEVDRTDVSPILALSANYRITKWLTLSASGSFATNDSNRDVFDYDVVNIGGVVSATFRF